MDDPRPLIEEITPEEFDLLAQHASQKAEACAELARDSRAAPRGSAAAPRYEALADYWFEKEHVYAEAALFTNDACDAWEEEYGRPYETHLAGLKLRRTDEAARRAKNEVPQ